MPAIFVPARPVDVVGEATVVHQFFLPLFEESSTISKWRLKLESSWSAGGGSAIEDS